MIKKLHINNYALFKNVEIDFTDGFTVVSGDTGAGKSIMLDALSLVLGKRVDRFAESFATQKSIIEADPSDGLFGDARTDEEQIGASYPELEWAMNMKDLGKTSSDFLGREKEIYEIFTKFFNSNLHKMNPIPVCLVPDYLK